MRACEQDSNPDRGSDSSFCVSLSDSNLAALIPDEQLRNRVRSLVLDQLYGPAQEHEHVCVCARALCFGSAGPPARQKPLPCPVNVSTLSTLLCSYRVHACLHPLSAGICHCCARVPHPQEPVPPAAQRSRHRKSGLSAHFPRTHAHASSPILSILLPPLPLPHHQCPHTPASKPTHL